MSLTKKQIDEVMGVHWFPEKHEPQELWRYLEARFVGKNVIIANFDLFKTGLVTGRGVVKSIIYCNSYEGAYLEFYFEDEKVCDVYFDDRIEIVGPEICIEYKGELVDADRRKLRYHAWEPELTL